jgi:hypothetical protein
MTKAKTVPTYAINIFRDAEDPKLYTAQFLRDGVVTTSVKEPSTYILCAAIMERKLRLAPHEQA